MSRRTTMVLAVLTATVVALVSALVVVARQNSPEPPRAIVSSELLARTTPSLTTLQRESVADVALSDLRVQGLIGGRPAKVAEVLVWTKSSGSLIGGVATVALSEPATIEGEWLAMKYDDSEQTSPPYTSWPYRAKYSNVTSLTVLVVVAVSPDHDSQAEGSPEVPSGATFPTGGAD